MIVVERLIDIIEHVAQREKLEGKKNGIEMAASVLRDAAAEEFLNNHDEAARCLRAYTHSLEKLAEDQPRPSFQPWNELNSFIEAAINRGEMKHE